MPGQKIIEDHARLMGRMADRLGTDLDEAELRGALTPSERDAMVLSCTNCTSPEDCRKWLDTHDSAEEAPGYCRNASKIKDLSNL